MKAWHLFLTFVFVCSLSIFSGNRIYDMHTSGGKAEISRLIYYPGSLVKALVLEFQGVVSDYLMLNSMIWHGEKIMEKVDVKPSEWQTTYLALNLITELDPRFIDPYIMAETSLPWDAGMVEETNLLLLKAASALPDDYRPYFFLWFNYYYFLHDFETAGMYLQKAAQVHGSPKYYKTLAARMSLESGNVLSGIVFLREMIQETNDPKTRVFLQKRLDALEIIYFLESKVREYVQKIDQQPEKLTDLKDRKIIEKIPDDPYGGNFYLTKDGRVNTTSKLVQQGK
ncbi:MAG: hypothetical protein SCH71_13220 [Desulfobulbaceae bacterium]|nr:hypothetical protein [Desulfobulbaceae bacterium]